MRKRKHEHRKNEKRQRKFSFVYTILLVFRLFGWDVLDIIVTMVFDRNSIHNVRIYICVALKKEERSVNIAERCPYNRR